MLLKKIFSKALYTCTDMPVCIRLLQFLMGYVYGAVIPENYNGAKMFQVPDDVTAVAMPQHASLHVCDNAGVNGAAANRVRAEHTYL